ncbi:MAG: F-type H+-transporting ATPase subunit alpha [Parcubacteria group bacterium Gr01-1014_30]|nr:MAG: F-type H+-transporting ATPase subunit alpha [Parcubacteria group bacterium Gr01-1014_30]
MSYDILEKLKKEIEGFKEKPEFAKVGVVVEAGDGIAKISGLSGALSQELLIVQTKDSEVPALAFNLEETLVGAVVLGQAHSCQVGDRVHKTGKVLSIKVGQELIGRVLSPVGEALDGKGVLFKKPQEAADYFLERQAPSVIDRESVNTPLHTGVKAIDSMIPIGRGQRELIIGDRQTGKTALALDAILNQKQDRGRPQVICVYVAIGQKNSKVAKIIKKLQEAGAIDYTIVVSAPASSPVALQYLAPYAGCAIGEYFMDKGRDALVIYDDLSKHADAYRQLSLLLRRPPGREAYPGDIFYLHARLLERATKLNPEKGGGSLTALPIIETKLGDVSAYIPTNVISITDGQIYLESGLFYQGIRPALNVGLSVSRIGSSAQTKAMKKVAGRLRLELAQFRELQAFVQFSSDLDENTRKQISRGRLLTEVLKQADSSPLPFECQVVLLFAALQGFADDVSLERVGVFEERFEEYLEKLHLEDILKPIQETGNLDEKTESALKKALTNFKNTF